MGNSWYDLSAHKTFAFTFAVASPIKFSFDQTTVAAPGRPAACRPLKRRRSLWDVDGGTSEGKKKRRLRLNLVTSRLSRPFSVPATNIMNREISKIAVWAKGRRLDKSLLRKAAIMNRVRTTLDAARAIVSRKEQSYRQAFGLQQIIVHTPRRYDVPPSSPLSRSYYDALDEDDEVFLDDDHDGDESGHVIYTDFNVMRPTSLDEGDEYDYLDELDGIPQPLPEEQGPPPLEDSMVEMFKEKERQKEVCFLHFVDTA